jgi:hypothetical protein
MTIKKYVVPNELFGKLRVYFARRNPCRETNGRVPFREKREMTRMGEITF